MDIVHVTPEYEGTYTCSAINSQTQTPVTRQLNLTVTGDGPGMPKIISITPNKEVQEGDNVTLECKTTGMPIPTVTWYRGSEPVQVTEVSFDYASIHCIVIQMTHGSYHM